VGTASRAILAQQALAQLVAADCGGEGALWSRQEAHHNAAITRDAALDAAEPLLDICADCPVVPACRQWAILDQYTGIAAGTSWVNGEEKPVHWVRGHPPKRTRQNRLAS